MSALVVDAEPVEAPGASGLRLLEGPWPEHGPESLSEHLTRLGGRPQGGAWFLDELDRAGLRGRGGAGFPTARKWSAVLANAQDNAVVVVNASEGEPWSAKDRTLIGLRPHLVLDGASIAAETLGARDVIVYLGEPFHAARNALKHALRDRRRHNVDPVRIRIVSAPHRYVSGEESALVRRVEGGPAKPRMVPPRPFEAGVGGRPTLVQNTESMAHVALIARFGADWFRSVGTETSPGSALLTVGGAVQRPGVIEVPLGVTIRHAVSRCGGVTQPIQAVLLGGYFGTWIPADAARDLRLDADALRAADGASLGCGVIAALPASGCGLLETARIAEYLAGESAGQCGPCVNGLAAIAGALWRLADGEEGCAEDVQLLERWTGQVRGRGGCRHPDGAARHILSALTTFAADVAYHVSNGPCDGANRASVMPQVPRVARALA
jgi:NADH:ubiquinone oxidoreductase subunit F (NADH-binding)